MLSLQEHLVDTHLLDGFFFVVLQEHLTSSTTASGAIGTLDKASKASKASNRLPLCSTLVTQDQVGLGAKRDLAPKHGTVDVLLERVAPMHHV